MKKLLTLSSLMLLTMLSASAQRVRLRAGPEMGINFTNMTARYEDIDGDDERESGDIKAGVKIGGVVDIGLTRHFAIQPGLFFSQKGYRNEIGRFDYSFNVNYLEFPINFLYKTSPSPAGRFFVGGGPYLATAVGGKYEDEDGNDESLDFGDNARNDDLRGFDAGMNITLGYEMPFGLFFRGNYGIGLANIRPDGDSDNSLRNWGFGLSVGFLFGR